MTNRVRAVAHDLNNVFAAILGCADLLVIRLKDRGPVVQELKEIQRAAERGARLTRRLFTLRPAAHAAGRKKPLARRSSRKR